MRYAVYFIPPAEHPLTQAASAWLGRDAYSGKTLLQPETAGFDRAEVAFMTAAPRRYGFHATIVAPFRLSPGKNAEDVAQSLDAFCASRDAFTIPELELGRIGRFFALIPAEPVPALNAMESAAVEYFQPMMAPLGESDIARREPDRLSATQRKNLLRWGYPYVREEFRFHMTLTGPVEPANHGAIETMIRGHFGPLIGQPVTVGALALFAECEPDGLFVIRSVHHFKQPASPEKTATTHV